MTTETSSTSKRVLDPVDRVAEVLFGLIMVMTFTGSLSVTEAGREDVRTMLIGALGCNLAWGIIDGLLYIMGNLAERARGWETFQSAYNTADPEHARRLIADAMPAVLASVIEPAELDAMHQRIKQLPSPPRATLLKSDWHGVLGVFLLVFLSTLPVVIPFVVMRDAVPALLRVSNGIAIVMLFMAGYAYGRIVGWHHWLMGISMVLLGLLLASLTMALGG